MTSPGNEKIINMEILEANQKNKRQFQLYIDGASRGNPGISGAGIVLTEDSLKEEFHHFLGEKTNNQAEYLALVFGLYLICERAGFSEKPTNVEVYSDSLLVVNQMIGNFSVKNESLFNLKQAAIYLCESIKGSFTFKHIPRSKNLTADKLANLGIDKKNQPPKDYKIFLEERGIFL